MNTKLNALILLLGIGFFMIPSTAFSLSVTYDAGGTTWYTNSISGVSTSSAAMSGMTVTAYFSDGNKTTLIWSESSSSNNVYGVWVGDLWSLSIATDGEGDSGKTYYSTGSETFEPWELIVGDTTLTGLFIDAGTGNAVFDANHISSGNPGDTPGSQSGYMFQEYNETDDKLVSTQSSSLEAVVTYSGIVALTGQEPEGDLYRYMTIDFGNGGFTNDTLLFSSDTDTVTSALVVPEPSTMLLFGAGLACLAGIARRRE